MRISQSWMCALVAALGTACGSVASDQVPSEAPPSRSSAEVSQDAARAALDVLERGLVDPDTVVDREFIQSLIEAKDRVSPPPFRAGCLDGPWLTVEESQEIGGRLRESLPRKRGPALMAAVRTVLSLDEASGPEFREAALRAWPEGDAEFRGWLLDAAWESLRCEEIVPLLREECDAVPPQTPWHVDYASTVALLRLLDVRPEEGRARILADLGRSDPQYGGRALVALPDEHLDEVDAQWRQPVDKLLHWTFDLEKWGPLAERYGGPDVVAKAKVLLDRPDVDRANFNASALLVRVVLAHDRPEGLRYLGQALRNGKERSGIRPAHALERVLGNNWIQQKDLWGPDAEDFVRGLAEDADPRIDEDTRKEAKFLLEHRARHQGRVQGYRNPPPR